MLICLSRLVYAEPLPYEVFTPVMPSGNPCATEPPQPF